MNTRRSFLIGTAGAALASSRVLGANDRIRMGIIGFGARGKEDVHFAQTCPNTEFVGFADVFTERLQEAKALVPAAKTYLDYRHLLEDRSLDAVIIATPQHLHREHFVASMQAGKHVYQEKTMAFSVDDAKRMREARLGAPKQVVQVGHQSCSFGDMHDVNGFLRSESMGKITQVVMHMFRNTAAGHPQWSRPLQPAMTAENIVWKAFLGDAPQHPFDANRYINWRFFWDYSGGNVYENMCHQIAFWYKALGYQIPMAVTMNGGIYLWKDGREVPDTMTVTLEQPEEMLISWVSGFGNNELESTEHILGTDGTIARTNHIAYIPQKVNNATAQPKSASTRTPPNAHMANFLDCVRSGAETNCPFELGYRVSIACRMAVDSYRQKRTVRWDAVHEQFV